MQRNRLEIIRSLVPLLAALAIAGAVLGASASATTPGSLVFASYRNGLSTIDTISADRSGKRQLTAPERSFTGEPAYSPDGSKIAYVCGNFELCVMNADGTGQGRLTTSRWPQTWEYVDRPTWSPDGTKIAFASNADGTFHVYVINADGTGLHKLAGTTFNDDDPAWSPDGTKIVFDNYKSWFSGPSAIYVMNADGTQPRRLSPRGVDGVDPTWSPDGSEVVYSAWTDEDSHLFVVNADGTDNHQLTDGFCDEMDPSWMPSGLGLAFDRNCGDRLGIADGHFGGGIVRITSPSRGFDLYPKWQPKTTGGPAAAPIGPPSTPTGDAAAVSEWFYWSTQVWDIDFLPYDSASLERRTLADDLAAVAALRAASPDTQRGELLRNKALTGFRFDAASSREFLLYYRATAHRQRRLARAYERAGSRLARRAEKWFNAADNVAELPY